MKKKLTFFTFGEDMFLRDIIAELRKDYNIKFFQRGSETEFFQMYHDCDIAWFEWCDDLIVQATQSPKMPSKIVCRLHSYELFTDVPAKVDWNKIDKLMFVSETVKNLFFSKFHVRPDIMSVIPNGVNMDSFKTPLDKKYNKKVVFVGYINYKKGPELLLQTFLALHEMDPEFTFHIAGDHQDERIALYFSYMQQFLPFQINFDGWVKDMPEYLKDKDYVLSTSLFESFQYALAEGMAQGVYPLIHNWPGALDLYPQEHIFVSVPECIDIVKKYNALKDKTAKQMEMRKYIEEHFSLEKQITSIKDLLTKL